MVFIFRLVVSTSAARPGFQLDIEDFHLPLTPGTDRKVLLFTREREGLAELIVKLRSRVFDLRL